MIYGISNFYRGSRLMLTECSKREIVGRLHQLVVNAYWGCKAPMERKTKHLKQGKCAAPEEGDEETFRSLPPCLPSLENCRNLIPLFLHTDTFSQPNNPASLVPPALASLEWCRGWGGGWDAVCLVCPERSNLCVNPQVSPASHINSVRFV